MQKLSKYKLLKIRIQKGTQETVDFKKSNAWNAFRRHFYQNNVFAIYTTFKMFHAFEFL